MITDYNKYFQKWSFWAYWYHPDFKEVKEGYNIKGGKRIGLSLFFNKDCIIDVLFYF